MLKVSSKNRPTADEILEMDIIKEKVELYNLGNDVDYEGGDILLSGKMKQITSKLPKSNYGGSSTQSSRKSQLGRESSMHESFAKHSKTNKSMHVLENKEEKRQKLESLLQNCYVIKKNKLNNSKEVIPKYYAVGEIRPQDKNFSSRNYGAEVNDYV